MSIAQLLYILDNIVQGEEYKEDFGFFTIENDIAHEDVIMRTDWFPVYDLNMELKDFESSSKVLYLGFGNKNKHIDFPLRRKNLAPYLKKYKEITIFDLFCEPDEDEPTRNFITRILYLKRVGKKLFKREEGHTSFTDDSVLRDLVRDLGAFLQKYSPTRETIMRAFGNIPLPHDVEKIAYEYMGES